MKNNLLRARVEGLKLRPNAHNITLGYSLAHVWLEVPTTLRLRDDNASSFRLRYATPGISHR